MKYSKTLTASAALFLAFSLSAQDLPTTTVRRLPGKKSASAKPARKPMNRRAAARAIDPNARRHAIVVLMEPSVVEHLASTGSRSIDAKGELRANVEELRGRMFADEGTQHALALRNGKAPLAAALQSRGVTVRSQSEHVVNALMVDATEADLAWLRSQPGVKSATFARTLHAHLDQATTLVGAQQAWSQISGGSSNAGRGQMIAMIDSGIDVTHPMFSASGFTAPAGFPKTDTAANSVYTNAKVIVAKNYVCPATGTCTGASSFDLNASDGAGHGTGTASVAAGLCTTTPLGSTICGVAPGAYLGNYKVFDSTGSGDDTMIIQAINDAVADGFKILNMSLGGDASGELPSDSPEATPIHNAVTAGAVVVISAGNCGPINPEPSCPYGGDNTMADPGIVPDAITVGASTNSHVLANPVTISSTATVPANLQTLSSFVAFTPNFLQIGPAVIVDVATLDTTGNGCSALPAGSLTGKVALMRWNDYCDDFTQNNRAAAAGAVAVLIADDIVEEVYDGFNGFLDGGTLPSTFISWQDGNNLQAFVAAHPGAVSASIRAKYLMTPQPADLLADFSSRGPVNDFTIKPDLVAPGDVYIASQKINADPNNAIYDSSGFLYSIGTSYSAPLVSGAAAILRQQRPALTAHDVKSALANSATTVTTNQDGATISAMHTGGGRLNIPAALATNLVSDPVSVTFGQAASPVSGFTQSQSVTLKNIGTSSETFNVSVSPLVSDPGLAVTTDKSQVTLGAGSTTTLNMKVALSATTNGVFEGVVNLQSTSGATKIHIPYWMMLGVPTLPVGSLVDGAGFGKTVSPGDIVSLFGTSLGTGGVNTPIIPLPYDLNHTQVTIDGRDTVQGTVEQSVPLFYSSSGQVNFQIPYTIANGRSDILRVYLEGITGNTTLTFTTQATSPGIFFSNGTAIVVHSTTQALVTASNPATAGEVVTVYCAGLGQVSPALYEGDPAPIPPATTTLVPTVKIGTTNATVSFSGLTPLLAGLYQINAQIGAGTPTGPQQITVTIGGNTSNSVTTYIK